MGARLVSATLNPHWSQLSHLEFRVLTVMALTALDTASNGHQPGVYWAGREYLATCIFATDEPTDWQQQKLKRAVAGLVRARAIERISVAAGQQRSRYRVTLDLFGGPPPLVEIPVDNSHGE